MNEMLIKWFPMLMNNRGELETGAEDGGEATPEEPASMEDLINEGLSNSEEQTGEEDGVSDTDDEDKGGEDEDGDKGGKADDESKPKEDDEDPEIDAGYEEDGKPVKMKMSEVRSSLKWIKENSATVGGALKIRELALKNPGFSKLINGVIEGSFGENNAVNEDYINNSLKALEVKTEKIEEKIEEKDDAIAASEAMLEELDPDSSQAMVIKNNIKIMKAHKALLKDQTSKIDAISEKLDGMDKKNTDAIKATEEAVHKEGVEKYRKILVDECSELTKEISFINDTEKKRFNQSVRDLVVGQSAKITNNDEFKKVIGESVKAVKKELDEYHQSIRNDYLKKKGKPPKEKEKETIPDPSKEVNQETLQNEIETLLMEGSEKG